METICNTAIQYKISRTIKKCPIHSFRPENSPVRESCIQTPALPLALCTCMRLTNPLWASIPLLVLGFTSGPSQNFSGLVELWVMSEHLAAALVPSLMPWSL